MKKFYLILIVFIGATLLSGNLFAEKKSTPAKGGDIGTVKIGVVDIEAVFKAIPEAVEADQQLKDKQKQYSDSLEAMQLALQDRFEKYQKQKGMILETEQQKEEKALQDEQQMYLTAREKFSLELQELTEKLVKPIRDKVNKIISDVAKSEGISLVLKKDITGMVIYADDALDITFLILDKMKRGK